MWVPKGPSGFAGAKGPCGFAGPRAPRGFGRGAAGGGAVAGGDRPGGVRRTFGVLRGTAARARSPIVRALATAGARGCP